MINIARSYEKTIVNNISFDSKTEAKFYLRLKKAKELGKIKDFNMKNEYILQDRFINWRGKEELEIKHYPDYLITLNDDMEIILDTKGSSFHNTDAKLKRKMWEYKNQKMPYYYVSISPVFLGSVWIDTSVGFDFLGKLKTKYKKIYLEVEKGQKIRPKFLPNQWKKYFVFHDVAGLFYVWDKTYTKKELEKIEKEKNK